MLALLALTSCSFFSGIGHADRTSPFADRADCKYARRSLTVDVAAVAASATVAATIDRHSYTLIPFAAIDELAGVAYLLSAGFGAYAIHTCERNGDAIWPPRKQI